MTDKYADMIYMPHPVSKKHSKMSILDRAAQFAPFAALTGYGAAIKETERLTEETPVLSQEQIDEINRVLFSLTNTLPTEVTVTYFVPDKVKSGGTYRKKTGIINKIDSNNQILIFADKEKIAFKSLISVVRK